MRYVVVIGETEIALCPHWQITVEDGLASDAPRREVVGSALDTQTGGPRRASVWRTRDRGAAVSMLRRLASRGEGFTGLRRLLASVDPSTRSRSLDDAAVLDALARKITTGAVTLWTKPLAPRGARGGGEGSEAQPEFVHDGTLLKYEEDEESDLDSEIGGDWEANEIEAELEGEWEEEEIEAELDGEWEEGEVEAELDGEWEEGEVEAELDGEWEGQDLDAELEGEMDENENDAA